MKRRNFLSGLMAAPLAVKARVARFFVRTPVEPCSATIVEVPVDPPRPRALIAYEQRVIQLMNQGKIDDEEARRRVLKLRKAVYRTADRHITRRPLFRCSLPRGHKGPHMLVNRHVKLTRLSFGDSQRIRVILS